MQSTQNEGPAPDTKARKAGGSQLEALAAKPLLLLPVLCLTPALPVCPSIVALSKPNLRLSPGNTERAVHHHPRRAGLASEPAIAVFAISLVTRPYGETDSRDSNERT